MIDEIQNSFLDKKNNILFICMQDLLSGLMRNQTYCNIKKNINILKT